ncbi:hypothetical protein HYU20_02755 [Candidatus Woesearchaeota archaeon]|nr:hypothetical protein [Candidatus Woesearchaeota archaeon]
METAYEMFLKQFQALHDGKMVGNALEEVRAAEKEADRIIEDSNRKKEAIISEARAKVARFLKEKEDDFAKRKAESMERLKEKLVTSRSKVLGEGSDKLKSLRKSAEREVDEAVELVVEAFESEISKL